MKPKGKVYEFYREILQNRKSVFLCKFCGQCYKNRNATRMTKHLIENCKKCPSIVKSNLKARSALSDISNSNSNINLENSSSSNIESTNSTLSSNDNRLVPFDEKNAQRALARAIYVSGQPLALVEHPLWKQFFKILNPTFNTPDRKALSTTFLEEEYVKIKDKIDADIKEAKVVHIALDGWTNIRNEPIINIIIYTPTPYFYKFIETKENRHTADYLFKEVCKIIDEIGSNKIMLVITDNASNMVKCGEMLSRKYPNIKWSGCLAHTLNLMIGDILKNEHLKILMSDIIDFIKCIHRSHILTADFSNIAQEKGIKKALQLPVKTRWGSHLRCINSVIECKLILQNMALNAASLSKFKNLLLDDNTWTKLEQLQSVLKPIVDWLTKLEGDRCLIHLVHTAFSEVQEVLHKPATVQILQESFCEELKVKFSNRKATTIKPIHLAATLLDPQNRGVTLTPEECIDGWEFIMTLVEEQSPSVSNFFKQVSEYKCRSGLWSKEFIWAMAAKVPAITWWETLFTDTELGMIALKVLTAPATSASTAASVERSFSTFANVHTKKRNRFLTGTAGKICLIAHNWKIINRKIHLESNVISSDPIPSTSGAHPFPRNPNQVNYSQAMTQTDNFEESDVESESEDMVPVDDSVVEDIESEEEEVYEPLNFSNDENNDPLNIDI